MSGSGLAGGVVFVPVVRNSVVDVVLVPITVSYTMSVEGVRTVVVEA